jgi:hypothetical protein
MRVLEEAMNPILMGQFLLILMGMCFAAFSFAMVQYTLINFNDSFRINIQVDKKYVIYNTSVSLMT